MERPFERQVKRRGERRAAALEHMHGQRRPRRLECKTQAGRRRFIANAERAKNKCHCATCLRGDREAL
jgi:hypothetical protein